MILVDIYVPSLDDTYDFMLDEEAEVGKIIIELSEMISKKVSSKVTHNADAFVLYWIEKRCVLDRNQSLLFAGVTDGCKLMLI